MVTVLPGGNTFTGTRNRTAGPSDAVDSQVTKFGSSMLGSVGSNAGAVTSNGSENARVT